MNRLEFHISYKCLNNCLFCSEHNQLEKFKGRFVPRIKIANELKKFSKKNFTHITFTGGEPTFHPDFVELLRISRELGYRTYVSSNGGLFYLKKFCRESLPFINEICLSIHGHNAKLHNFHTKNSESFHRLNSALENIEKSPYEIYEFANIVVTKYNFLYLEKIIDFISRYKKMRQVLISNIAPEGNGLHNFKELVVPLSRFQKKIEKVVSLAEKRLLTVRFFGVPLCILGGYESFSNDIHWSPRATIEKWGKNRNKFLKTTVTYKPVRKRIKTNKCNDCKGREICGGLFRSYYQEFSDNDLRPIL